MQNNLEQPMYVNVAPQGIPHPYSFEEAMIINRELELDQIWRKLKTNKREEKALLKRFNELKKLSTAHSKDPLADSD